MDPIELVVIGAVVLVIMVMVPKKIPELARSMGLSKKQFNDAKKGVAG